MTYPKLFDLTGQVAVVTGAASGLGVAFCEAIAEAGADVVCADIDRKGLGKIAEHIRSLGQKALLVECDVSNENDVIKMMKQTNSEFGRLDILFNNAGIADVEPSPVHLYKTENWLKVMSVDVNGVFFCAREALKIMIGQKSGKIINIASMWGLAGSSSVFPIPAYSTAKGAVVNLTRELALEYAPYNIHVNAICPGFYRTRLAGGAYDDPEFVKAVTAFTPMNRIADAEEIKGTALYLASAASDYVTGLMLVADGGCMAK